MYVNGTSICTMLIINIIIIKTKKADIIAACNGEAFFHIEENKCFIRNRNFILSFLTNQSQSTNILADCALKPLRHRLNLNKWGLHLN